MTIGGKVYCFFEQSGTFKNEFMRFGSKKPTTLAVGGIEPRSFFVY